MVIYDLWATLFGANKQDANNSVNVDHVDVESANEQCAPTNNNHEILSDGLQCFQYATVTIPN
jgi:hypothetical protein